MAVAVPSDPVRTVFADRFPNAGCRVRAKSRPASGAPFGPFADTAIVEGENPFWVMKSGVAVTANDNPSSDGPVSPDVSAW